MDSLPTKSNLCKRKILGDPTGGLCLKEPETILDALWGCEKIQAVWKRGFAGLHDVGQQLQSVVELVDLVQEKHRSFNVFAMTC